MAVQTVRDIMTSDPRCCSPQDSVAAAARLMVSGDFGAVPVTDPQTRRLLGILTDRDITCRVVANDLNPGATRIQDAMTRNPASLGPRAGIKECVRLMEQRQVRRVPIVDDRGTILGIVAQADLARASARERELEHELAEMVEEVSERPQVQTSRGNTRP